MRPLFARLGSGPLAGLLLCLVIMAVAAAFMAHERFLYYWDWAGFHGITVDFARAVTHDPAAAWQQFRGSLSADYNLIFALPLVPVMVLSDGSRTAYVVAVAGLYLTPFALMVGAIGRRAFPALGTTATVLGVLLALCVPPVWMTVMRGYPDVLAAAVMLAGLLVMMGDPRFDRWRSVLATAFLVAAAVVIRRHMAYAAAAMVGTAGLLALLHLADVARNQGQRAAVQTLWSRRTLRVAALPVAVGAFIALLNPYFVVNLLRHDYGALYASYQMAPLRLVQSFINDLMGGAAFTLAVVGLVLGLARLRLRPTPMAALSLYGLLWTLLWFLAARQNGPHHIIVTMPLMVVAGALHLADLLRGHPRLLRSWITAISGGAVVVAFVTNGPWQPVHSLVRTTVGLVPLYFGPMRRDDFDIVRTMIEDLRRGPQPVLVAASSEALNFDILAKAEPRFFGQADRRLSLLASPQVDSRDPMPIEDLLQAGQVIVAEPFQYHLADPAEQEVVSVVLTAFRDGWPVAADFVRREAHYPLMGKAVDAVIYERVRPSTAATALDTYQRMVKVLAGEQSTARTYWYVETAQTVGIAPTAMGGRSMYVAPPLLAAETPLRLTLLRPDTGAIRLSGQVLAEGAHCPADMRLAFHDARSGQLFESIAVPADETVPFSFSGAPAGTAVGLEFSAHGPERDCYLNLLDVTATPTENSTRD